MTTYRAGRANEEPGITFTAATVNAAKAKASRSLEGGAFQGQKITLVEMCECDDGSLMSSFRIWQKKAHTGKWVAFGDAK